MKHEIIGIGFLIKFVIEFENCEGLIYAARKINSYLYLSIIGY